VTTPLPGQTAAGVDAFAGMTLVDLDLSPRIPILLDMVAGISRAQDPRDVLREFSLGMAKIQDRPAYVSLSTRDVEPGEYRITRMIVDRNPKDEVAKANPWRNRHAIPIHRGGFLGAIVERGAPVILHDLAVHDDPVVGDAFREFGSLMAVPLYDDGRALNWAIMLRGERNGFDLSEMEETILRANLIGSNIRNVVAAQQLRAANDRIQREVEAIARIQRSLLPETLPEITGVTLGASYETFDTAGGDLYDFVPLRMLDDGRTPDPDGTWGIQIADASGHGPAAATVVAMLNAILYAAPQGLEHPAAMLEFANHHLLGKRLEGTFVTAVLAKYEPSTRRFTYARAGHNPVLHMTAHPDGARIARLDEVGGTPLGVVPDMRYEEHTIQLEPGQTLVFYTDGITEAAAPDGAMFDLAGIERSLTECTGHPDCVITHVTKALVDHEAGVRPADDQTIVVMRVS
jgi:sigma-B regulation protein RsbU (phosphoserine phosphatase)